MHDDLHSRNLLMCEGGHLKLADFDRAAPIGSRHNHGMVPYAIPGRVVYESAKVEMVGAATEIFAIGTNVYFMTRGFDPYEDELGFDEDSVCEVRFMKKQFPRLDTSNGIDRIIDDCWNIRFTSVRSVKDRVVLLGGDVSSPRGISDEHHAKCRHECEVMVSEGLLDLEMPAATVGKSAPSTTDTTQTARAPGRSLGSMWNAFWTALEAQSG